MEKNKIQIEYLEKNQDDLEIVRPLWQKLNQHHIAVSKYQKNSRTNTTFDMRKKQLLEKSHQGALQINLARDSNTKEYIGYCVTTINSEKQGEIESLYVEKDYRGTDIGDSLMTRALGWLKTMSVKKQFSVSPKATKAFFHFIGVLIFILALPYSGRKLILNRMENYKMDIRPFSIEDEKAVKALWQKCDLVRPWNDPHSDIQRKLKVNPELFLVGTLGVKIIATAMGGYEGHRGWVNYLAVDPTYRKKGFGR